MPKRYPQQLRDRAVRMVVELRDAHATESAAIVATAARLGIGSAETLRRWVRQAEVDAGTRPSPAAADTATSRRRTHQYLELRLAIAMLDADPPHRIA